MATFPAYEATRNACICLGGGVGTSRRTVVSDGRDDSTK